jgi:heterogeneous nuclear ribonucleoprotein U-like protein 1
MLLFYIKDEPFAPIKSDFKLIQKLAFEQRVFNGTRLLEKSECEAVFLIGLPGVGKTRWAKEYLRKNPGKSFSIIGFSTVLEKMRVRKCSTFNIKNF